MTTRGRDTAQLVTSRREARPASWLEAGWPRDLRRPLWLVPATVPRPDAGGGGQVAPVWTDRRGSGDARSDASTGTPALQACSAGQLVLRGHSATPARWPTALSTATCLHMPPTPRGAAPQRPDAWFTTLPTRRSGPAPRLRWSPRGLWAARATRVQGRDTAASAPGGAPHPPTLHTAEGKWWFC